MISPLSADVAGLMVWSFGFRVKGPQLAVFSFNHKAITTIKSLSKNSKTIQPIISPLWADVMSFWFIGLMVLRFNS